MLDLVSSCLVVRCQSPSTHSEADTAEVHLALSGKRLLVHGLERDPLEGTLSRWMKRSRRFLVQVSRQAIHVTLSGDALTEAILELQCGRTEQRAFLNSAPPTQFGTNGCRPMIDREQRTVRFDVTQDLRAILRDEGCVGWLIEAPKEHFPFSVRCQRA